MNGVCYKVKQEDSVFSQLGEEHSSREGQQEVKSALSRNTILLSLPLVYAFHASHASHGGHLSKYFEYARYILKVKPLGFTKHLTIRYDRKRGVKDD